MLEINKRGEKKVRNQGETIIIKWVMLGRLTLDTNLCTIFLIEVEPTNSIGPTLY